jgi:SNF2 family DNA or RNA helicase
MTAISFLYLFVQEDIPDPEGFPQEMMERREAQRSFLRQLLDGSQVEPYVIPVDINAELRHYQQDGVSWLAFLCKYQLHGILCDGEWAVYPSFISMLKPDSAQIWGLARACKRSAF